MSHKDTQIPFVGVNARGMCADVVWTSLLKTMQKMAHWDVFYEIFCIDLS